MKARLSFVLVVCVVGAGLISSTAAADRPVKEELSPVGDQFDCGGTLLTVTGGNSSTSATCTNSSPGVSA